MQRDMHSKSIVAARGIAARVEDVSHGSLDALDLPGSLAAVVTRARKASGTPSDVGTSPRLAILMQCYFH